MVAHRRRVAGGPRSAGEEGPRRLLPAAGSGAGLSPPHVAETPAHSCTQHTDTERDVEIFVHNTHRHTHRHTEREM